MHFIIPGVLSIVSFVVLLVLRSRRLRHIPGPFLCSVTDLYRSYQQNTQRVDVFLLEAHEKYGPVLRIGPNTVSVSKAAAIPVIYTMRGEFKKAESYNCLPFYFNGVVSGSVVDIQDEAYNTNLKRAFGAAFTSKNVQDYEDLVDASSQAMLDRLRTKARVDVFDMLRRFQIDFLLKAAFSEESHFSNTDEDIERFSFHPRFLHWTRWQALHKVEHLLYKSLLVNKLWELFCTPTRPTLGVMTHRFLEGRLSQRTMSSDRKDLLDKWLDAQEKHSDVVDIATVRRMVASTINAGFDTTAYTMSMVLFELLKHPNDMAFLREELHNAQAAGALSNPPQWTEVNKLPYLDAVIKETMRTHALLHLPLERVVPDGGVTILGTYLPAGTVVGCSAGVTGFDPVCFGDDAHLFIPQRWLTTDDSKRVAMERGSLGFGSGKRGCIGRHIAVLEMKKVIPALLLNFEIALARPGTQVDSVDGITSFPKPIEMNFTAR